MLKSYKDHFQSLPLSQTSNTEQEEFQNLSIEVDNHTTLHSVDVNIPKANRL